jgi:hypothetical protein
VITQPLNLTEYDIKFHPEKYSEKERSRLAKISDENNARRMAYEKERLEKYQRELAAYERDED